MTNLSPIPVDSWTARVTQNISMTLLGKPFVCHKIGTCAPTLASMIFGGVEVYRWERKGDTREEFFDGVSWPARIYYGDQLCFWEYCGIANNHGSIPPREAIIDFDQQMIPFYEASFSRIISLA